MCIDMLGDCLCMFLSCVSQWILRVWHGIGKWWKCVLHAEVVGLERCLTPAICLPISLSHAVRDAGCLECVQVHGLETNVRHADPFGVDYHHAERRLLPQCETHRDQSCIQQVARLWRCRCSWTLMTLDAIREVKIWRPLWKTWSAADLHPHWVPRARETEKNLRWSVWLFLRRRKKSAQAPDHWNCIMHLSRIFSLWTRKEGTRLCIWSNNCASHGCFS